MGVINRVPLGLLDLLQSKTDGRNPGDMSDQVVPTIDIEPYYLASRASFEFFVVSTTAVGAIANIDVNDSEVWFLYAIDTEWIAVNIGDIVQLSVELSRFADAPSPLSAVTIFAPPADTAVAIGDVHTRSIIFDRPLPMPSGMRVQGVVSRRSLTTNVAVNLAIYRLTI